MESNTATYTWTVGNDNATTTANTSAKSSTNENNGPDASARSSTESNAALTPSHSVQARDAGGQGQVDVEKQAAPDNACVPGLVPLIKDDRRVPATWASPQSLEFSLGPTAKKSLPSAVGPVPAGEVWMIGATQEPGVPWLGANTQHPSMLEAGLGPVTWELVSFDGPGAMSVYTQGGLGQIVGEEWFNADNGRGFGTHTIAPNSHVHPVWLFSAPGTYKVGIKQSASKDGKTYSGAGVLTFHVGGGASAANDGHFDLGAEFNAAGGDCGAAGVGGSSNASQNAKGTLAQTGSTFMTLPYAALGLGMIALGAGVVRLAVLTGRAKK
ncbi:choice-of-anchor M domain-containing protein [Corynebacterium mayonis]|uniref:choice-of-anchor M domain-containing protein n=1 Tax=Corynebacterium mayonis TaxID=3062461 RepID=UPI003140C33F